MGIPFFIGFFVVFSCSAAAHGCIDEERIRTHNTVYVSKSTELINALQTAVPGTSIKLADGTYMGNFTATTNGDENNLMYLSPQKGVEGKVTLARDPDLSGEDAAPVLLVTGKYWRVVNISIASVPESKGVGLLVKKGSFGGGGMNITGFDSAVQLHGMFNLLWDNDLVAKKVGISVEKDARRVILKGNRVTRAPTCIDISDGARSIKLQGNSCEGSLNLDRY